MGKMTQISSPLTAKLQKAVEDLGHVETKVGWFESARYADGTPVAYVATIQEFGAPSQGIPMRPFMRPTVVTKAPDWRVLMEGGAKAILNGTRTPYDVFDILGQVAAGDVRQAIADLVDPPLSQLTIAIRKYLRDAPSGTTMSGKKVGEIASDLKKQGANFDPDGVSTKPLIFSSLMLGTLTHLTTVTP